MRWTPRISLVVLGSLTLLLSGLPALAQAPPAAAATWQSLQVTHNWNLNSRPELSGDRLVWQASDGVDWEIVTYDLTSGAFTQLTDDGTDETDPQLDGDWLLWISHREALPPQSYTMVADSGSTLTLYDFASGKTRTIPGSENVLDARLVGDLIVWRSGQGESADVYVHDLSTGKTTRLTDDYHHQSLPQTDGRLVAIASDLGETSTELEVYDAGTGVTQRLGGDSVVAASVQLNAGRVAWQESDGADWSVFLWDQVTEETWLLSSSDQEETSLALGSDTVAWLRWDRPSRQRMIHDSPWAVVTFDLATGEEREVAEDAWGGLWADPQGSLLAYTRFESGAGAALRLIDLATGLDVALDPNPEASSGGGVPAGLFGGRGVMFFAGPPGPNAEYVVGPSFDGDHIAFTTYQSVNGVYNDSDVVLAFRGNPPAEPSVPSPPTRHFADIAGSPYSLAITDLGDRGIIRGYRRADHLEFAPEEPALRWQFLRMVLEATGVNYTFLYGEQPPFGDLIGAGGEDFFLRRVVEAGYELGITKGTTDHTFGPYAAISRAEAVTMLVRAAEVANGGSTAIPADYMGSLAGLSGTHADSLRRAEYHGLLAGLEGFGPTWDPFDPMTRGEAALVLVDLLDKG